MKLDHIKAPLRCEEILALTNNENGIDISSREMLDPINYVYYDWLSYEIINSQADYCFVPFGTGDLYHNILNIHSKEYFSESHDPRLELSGEPLKATNYVAVTTTDMNSKCDKLYSPFLPFSPIKRTQILAHKENGVCGPMTDLRVITEGFVDEAIRIAESRNIMGEPSGIAGIGMLKQMADEIPTDAKILIVNTGKLRLG